VSLTVFDDEEIAAAAAERRVSEWLAARHIEVVHLGIFDACGTLRAKRLGAAAAARAFERGWSFIDAIQWWGPTGGGRFRERAALPLRT
jgi:hypothetical protein